MSKARRADAVVTPLDLLLALVALAAGVWLRPLVLPLDLAVHPVIIVQTPPISEPWFAVSEEQEHARGAVRRSRTASTIDRVVAARTPSFPVQSSEPQFRQSYLVPCACDWRRELQHLATWSRPAEAPAGASRYPIASPSHHQREDLPHP